MLSLVASMTINANLSARLLHLQGTRLAAAPGTVMLILVAVLGTWRLSQTIRQYDPDHHTRAAERLVAETLRRLPQAGNNYPLVDIGPGTYPVGPGFALGLARNGTRFTFDVDDAALFGSHLAPAGQEDVLLSLTLAEGHDRLRLRPGNVVLAHDPFTDIYVDAVSLIDDPGARYRR